MRGDDPGTAPSWDAGYLSIPSDCARGRVSQGTDGRRCLAPLAPATCTDSNLQSTEPSNCTQVLASFALQALTGTIAAPPTQATGADGSILPEPVTRL